MKLVQFTRDFLPQRAGESRVLPDDVAERLVAAGDAIPKDSPFDRDTQSVAAPKRGYVTKKRG